MMFFHAAFALELLALAAGVGLFIYSKNQDKVKSYWITFIAWLVIILSAVSVLCSVYNAVAYWPERKEMHKAMMMHKMEHHKKVLEETQSKPEQK